MKHPVLVSCTRTGHLETRAPWLLVLVMGLAYGATSSSVAHAEAPPTSATEYFDAAVAHAERGELADAADDFERAQQLAPHPSTLLNLARVRARLGQDAQAVAHFEQWLQAPTTTDGATSTMRAEVERELAQARTHMLGAAAVRQSATTDSAGASSKLTVRPSHSTRNPGESPGARPPQRPTPPQNEAGFDAKPLTTPSSWRYPAAGALLLGLVAGGSALYVSHEANVWADNQRALELAQGRVAEQDWRSARETNAETRDRIDVMKWVTLGTASVAVVSVATALSLYLLESAPTTEVPHSALHLAVDATQAELSLRNSF